MKKDLSPSSSLLDAYREEIRKEVEALAYSSIEGGCENFADYQKKCGQASGLDRAFTIFKEVVTQFINEEE